MALVFGFVSISTLKSVTHYFETLLCLLPDILLNIHPHSHVLIKRFHICLSVPVLKDGFHYFFWEDNPSILYPLPPV